MGDPGRLGVLGGTFDPIHHGHLFAAACVCHALDLDGVLFVPAGQPWQKADRRVTAAEHRVVMVELAVEPVSGFELSRVDVDRDGPTYTVDTLRDVRAARPGAEVSLIVGADAAEAFHTWRDPDAILELAQVVVVPRPGAESRAARSWGGVSVTMPTLDISSTRIRERVGRGEPVTALVPTAVEAYIQRHGLYGA